MCIVPRARLLVLAIFVGLACHHDEPFDPSLAVVSTPATLIAAPVSLNQIALTWQDNSHNESGFEVHRSTTGPTGTFTLLGSTGAGVTTFADAGLNPATQYCYKVRAFKVSGPNTSYSQFSTTTCATTLPPPLPPAASGVNATPRFGSAINITWADNSGNETGFRVERAAAGSGPWTAAGTTTANATSLDDDQFPGVEQPVCYRVFAFNGYGDSGPSNVDCTAVPAAPTNLAATSTDARTIDLTWTDNSAVEDGYAVERSGGGGVWSVIAALPAGTTTGTMAYRDGTVTANVRYDYRVRATRDQGSSGFSNEASGLVSVPVSPGSLIAFSSNRDGDYAIFVMSPDGSGVTRLTDPSVRNAHPSWAPDGARIAFSGDAACFRDIYVMNRDGSSPVPLTSCEGVNRFPAWSPDGQHIAFASDRDAVCSDICGDDIYVMSTDGSDVRRLTDNPGEDWLPAWSPDGSKIVFSSDRDGTYPALDIYVMNADGSGLVRLTYDAAFNITPAWSPDGTKIAFSSDRDGYNEIYVMNADGSSLVRLTQDQSYNLDPAWSPDGSRIAFMRSIIGCDDSGCYITSAAIAVMNADGSGLVNITDGVAEDGEPSWGRSLQGAATLAQLRGGSRMLARAARSPGVRPKARIGGTGAKGAPRAVTGPAETDARGRVAVPARRKR
jgi:Tol biopolymer transport system component